jgi:hypothetical protein
MNRTDPGAASEILLSAPINFAVQLVEPTAPFKKRITPQIIQDKPSIKPERE